MATALHQDLAMFRVCAAESDRPCSEQSPVCADGARDEGPDSPDSPESDWFLTFVQRLLDRLLG